MDTKIIFIALALLGIGRGAAAQSGIPDLPHVNIGLVYPLSTNGLNARQCTNFFSLNAFAGLSRSETGFCAAGFANIILDSAAGVQIAGFVNFIRNNASGVQVAGFVNRSGNAGAQVAGFVNASRGAGTQVAGFVNKSETVRTQVAGFINVAKKVKGVQIAGFINIADSSDYPIAVFNFVRSGEMSLGVSTDESLTTLLTFRSGGRILYGIAGLGYNHKGERALSAWEAGLGAHLVSASYWRLNVEAVNGGLTDFQHGTWMQSSLRVLPVYRPSHRVELFAGPSLNYFHTRNGQAEDVVDHYLWSERKAHSFYGLFFGVTGGISISLTNK